MVLVMGRAALIKYARGVYFHAPRITGVKTRLKSSSGYLITEYVEEKAGKNDKA
jgi:hypothetical protein